MPLPPKVESWEVTFNGRLHTVTVTTAPSPPDQGEESLCADHDALVAAAKQGNLPAE